MAGCGEMGNGREVRRGEKVKKNEARGERKKENREENLSNGVSGFET